MSLVNSINVMGVPFDIAKVTTLREGDPKWRYATVFGLGMPCGLHLPDSVYVPGKLIPGRPCVPRRLSTGGMKEVNHEPPDENV